MTLAYAPPATAPAPVEVAARRDQFPGDLCPGSDCPDNAKPKADRGSGRDVAYTVWIAGYEVIKAETGEPISREFVTPVIHLDVPSGGAFGVGETEFINSWVAEHFPGYTVSDAMIDRASLEFVEF